MATLEGSITYEGISEIIANIDENVASVVDTLVKKAASEILRHIMAKEFPKGTTRYYQKTGELADAVSAIPTSKGSRVVSFFVYIDTRKLSMTMPSNGKLGQHMGIHGEDFRSGIPDVLNNGSVSPIYSHPAHHFIEEAFGEMSKTLINVLAEGLRSRGFEVVIE